MKDAQFTYNIALENLNVEDLPMGWPDHEVDGSAEQKNAQRYLMRLREINSPDKNKMQPYPKRIDLVSPREILKQVLAFQTTRGLLPRSGDKDEIRALPKDGLDAFLQTCMKPIDGNNAIALALEQQRWWPACIAPYFNMQDDKAVILHNKHWITVEERVPVGSQIAKFPFILATDRDAKTPAAIFAKYTGKILDNHVENPRCADNTGCRVRAQATVLHIIILLTFSVRSRAHKTR